VHARFCLRAPVILWMLRMGDKGGKGRTSEEWGLKTLDFYLEKD